MRRMGEQNIQSPPQVAHTQANANVQCSASRRDHAPEFNVPTALDMACVAWQTWRHPNQGAQYLYEGIDGTTVQFLNRTFVTRNFTGVLKISARKLGSNSERDSLVRLMILVISLDNILAKMSL